jgi:hypothetical protein
MIILKKHIYLNNTATAMGWKIIRILPGKYGDALRYIEMILKLNV